MGSFGRWPLPASAAFLEGTGLGGSGGLPVGRFTGFRPCCCGVMARVVKSMPPTGGGSGGVLGPGTSGRGVSGTSSVALKNHDVSGVVCGVSGGLVGMAGGCTVGGRLGGYLSLGAAGGVGLWAGAAVAGAGQLRGLDLEDSCAWLRAAGPGTGSEGDWWPSAGTGDGVPQSAFQWWVWSWVETKVAGGWGCRRKPLGGDWAVVPPSGLEQVAGCEGGVGSLFVRWVGMGP